MPLTSHSLVLGVVSCLSPCAVMSSEDGRGKSTEEEEAPLTKQNKRVHNWSGLVVNRK